MNAAFSQLEISRRIKITWPLSNDATEFEVEGKFKLFTNFFLFSARSNYIWLNKIFA